MENGENKRITKPITLVRDDFIISMTKLINEAQMPAFVVESVLKDFLNEVHMASVRQTESDRQEWEKLMNNNQK